jgi:hypothetical protein
MLVETLTRLRVSTSQKACGPTADGTVVGRRYAAGYVGAPIPERDQEI